MILFNHCLTHFSYSTKNKSIIRYSVELQRFELYFLILAIV